MKQPLDCLRCLLWDTIRDRAARAGATLDGRAICDRDELLAYLACVIADVLYSNPDLNRESRGRAAPQRRTDDGGRRPWLHAAAQGYRGRDMAMKDDAQQPDSRQPWMKFFPPDWRGDITLGPCSLAARGLWMEMLCIMHEAKPRGSLVKDGEPYTPRRLAAVARAPVKEVERLLAELEAEGVFSRDPEGTIFSRRMRRDIEKAATDRRNGGLGGNPKLKGRHKGGVNPPDNGQDKAQKPEARSQIPDPSSIDDGRDRGSVCDRFFAAFPKFDEPDGVQRELLRIIDEGAAIEDIVAGAKRYAKSVTGKDAKFIASPLRWLQNGRWREAPDKPKDEVRVPGREYTEGWLIAKETPQGRAWVAHRVAVGARPANVFEHHGVGSWFFETEWPPSRSQPDQDRVEHAA